MPQKPTLVGAKTSGCEVFLFDYAKHASKPSQTSDCDPDLRLLGHDMEGYGLSWSPFKEGYLLSGSQDKKICLWDVSATPQDKVLNAMFVYEVRLNNTIAPIFFSGTVIFLLLSLLLSCYVF